MYRLNMQIGNLMQHVIFPDNASAMNALAKIYKGKAESWKSCPISDNALVDPVTISFAEIKPC
jgi:hypothetical protein